MFFNVGRVDFTPLVFFNKINDPRPLTLGNERNEGSVFSYATLSIYLTDPNPKTIPS